MGYLIGIDIGTSGTKTVLFNETGGVVASKTVEYPLFQPQNGWAEQNPLHWREAVLDGISSVLSKSDVPKHDILGIGLSGQMHGLVMLDKNNEVIRPAILWCDSRTGKECEQMTNKIGQIRLVEITANPALVGFTASKILWVQNNEPNNYERCAHILLPKDYIRFVLTKEFATEVSDASGMQLLDVPKRCWSQEVCHALGIDMRLLPKVYESQEITGTISPEIAKQTGLSEKTLVVGGAGDNAAAAVGTGVVKNGLAFTTIGSSGVVYAHTDEVAIDPKGRVHTFCCAVPNKWHVMGVTQGAGLSLKWFRDQFCQEEISLAKEKNIDPYEILNEMASKVAIGSDRLLFLPYLMGERTPHLDPNCRGMFFGISAMHTKAHFVRAIMEGVAFSQQDSLSVLQEMGVSISHMAACGGGGKSALWREMLANVYQCPVGTMVSQEGPALGVAILAGVGAGVFKSVEEGCHVAVAKNSEQKPNHEHAKLYAKFYDIYKSLYPSVKENYRQLSLL